MKSLAELKKMYKDLNTENIKLKQTIEIMKQEYMELVQTIEMQGQTIEMQGQTIEKLNLSVAELKRRLVRHDNYNTPPSQKKGPGWPDAKKSDDKIMEIINPQKRARGRTARTRPAARNRAGGKKATRAAPAGQNPPSSRSTPRTPVPSAARATSP